MIMMEGLQNNKIEYLLALTQALLCVRVLGFMKMINMRLATSVLAIMQILIDIFSFLSVLIVFLLGFAQIFTTFDLFKVGDMNFWKNFRRTYYILLGEFEMTNVTIDGKFAFFFVFTFFVIIILLNVLIAIVGDSYEKSLIHSEKLFGRARVETVAEL